MKRMSITTFALTLASIFFGQNVIASDFKMVKREGDITLYERWITGSKNESVRELKAEFSLKADVESVIGLLKDQPSGTRWNRNASLYRIAGAADNNEWINYIKYDMPALFDDQECCLLYKAPASFLSGRDVCVITFESTLNDLFPVDRDIKRVTGINGQWRLERQPAGMLKVTYIISSDRSTNVPRFISDPIVHNNLFRTMQSFKAILEK